MKFKVKIPKYFKLVITSNRAPNDILPSKYIAVSLKEYSTIACIFIYLKEKIKLLLHYKSSIYKMSDEDLCDYIVENCYAEPDEWANTNVGIIASKLIINKLLDSNKLNDTYKIELKLVL